MMWIAESYAKINLGLQVLERLPTGFHRIETGYCFLEWKDRFEVETSSHYKLHMGSSSIPAGEENLITQAYRRFETYIGLKRHYSFNVRKIIPAGAGLGGGSSNAALTLRILNKLEETDLTPEELMDLSRDLGSDIAFFLMGEPAIGRDLGQTLTPADLQPDCWIVTVFPGIEISTQEVYSRCIPNPDPDFSLVNVLTEAPLEEWRFLLQNDLEAAVLPIHELVGNIKDQFYEFGAEYASMSGSGSAVFGLFEQDFVAIQAYQGYQDLGFTTTMTRPGFQPDYGIYQKG